MSRKRIDHTGLIGKKFNRLTVVDAYRDNYLRILCKCNCDCGSKDLVNMYDHLKRGRSKSCGCLRIEKLIQRKLVVVNDLSKNFVGVYKMGNAYVAQIQHVKLKTLHLGSFVTEKEARKARVLKELELLDEINEKLYEKIEVNQETVNYYLS